MIFFSLWIVFNKSVRMGVIFQCALLQFLDLETYEQMYFSIDLCTKNDLETKHNFISADK